MPDLAITVVGDEKCLYLTMLGPDQTVFRLRLAGKTSRAMYAWMTKVKSD